MSTSVARSDELAFAGLHGQAQALAAGEVSAVELVELALERIEASQPTLNAFRCVRAAAAREEASQADSRLAAGQREPLLGLPLAIKDDTDLVGETTEFGCPGSFEPKNQDSEVVRRVKAAGAVIVGKTTTPELGQWPITEGPAFGKTRNPWSLRHTPGGSSGGSAAAVAAGLVPAALGSDGLGSVRIPAAWTHLVGIKPQRGRISTWPYADAFNGLTCIGPLARTVADAALLLDTARGNNPGDRDQPPAPAEPFLRSAERADPGRPLRIALALRAPFSIFPTQLDTQIAAAVERLAGVLSSLGHQVEEANPRYGVLGAGVIPRSFDGLAWWLRELHDTSALDHRTREVAGMARFLSPVLGAGRALEMPMRWQLGSIFRRFDVVLAPTTAKPPMPVGRIDGLSGWETDKTMISYCPYTWPWNAAGWPVVNVPAGLTNEGLPIGAQLVGPESGEVELISLAAQLEAVERWHARRPPHTGGEAPL